MEECRTVFKISPGKPTGKRPLGKPSIDGGTILEWILKKQTGILGIGLIRLRIGIFGEPL